MGNEFYFPNGNQIEANFMDLSNAGIDIHRDLFKEINEKRKKLIEKIATVGNINLVFSADMYLLFCEQCAERSQRFVFGKNFSGMNIVVIPNAVDYLEMVPDEFEKFMYAFPDSVRGIRKTTIAEFEKGEKNG